jgi:bifunctional DNA-binding transcriptional regulator/antitoxin component of YhaV-PrlF toxin-antitoxin module
MRVTIPKLFRKALGLERSGSEGSHAVEFLVDGLGFDCVF